MITNSKIKIVEAKPFSTNAVARDSKCPHPALRIVHELNRELTECLAGQRPS